MSVWFYFFVSFAIIPNERRIIIKTCLTVKKPFKKMFLKGLCARRMLKGAVS